jgi:anti-sigma regulatory factor (Ser/Thr protein kinase)
MGSSVRLELAATVKSPGSARRFVTDQLAMWGYATLTADAALLTSELVTNAVAHGAEPYAVEVVDLDDGVLVTVEDAAHEAVPAPRRQGSEAESGRGLAIVDSIATAWGTSAVPGDGKVVWFRLTPPPH